MDNIDIFSLQNRIETMLPSLNEYQQRRYLASEAKSLGHGGITLVSELSGVSNKTISKGIKELEIDDAPLLPLGRCRKAGGGRKPIWESESGILIVLESLISPHTKGDPGRLLLWTNKSLRNLSDELKLEGYTANRNAVTKMLKKLGYTSRPTRRP